MTLAEIVQWTEEAGRRTDGPGPSPVTAKQRQRLAELNRMAQAQRTQVNVFRKVTRPAMRLVGSIAACFVAVFVRSHN
jgi:hypothetical protein